MPLVAGNFNKKWGVGAWVVLGLEKISRGRKDAALSEQRGCGIALAALTAQHGGSHSYGLP